MVMSPKKSKEIKQVEKQADPDNPTIIKLNKIFNNLFDKKDRKTMTNFSSNKNP